MKASLLVELLAGGERKLRHICLFTDVLVCAKQKQSTAESSLPAPVNSPIIDTLSGDQLEVKWFIPLTELVLYKSSDTDHTCIPFGFYLVSFLNVNLNLYIFISKVGVFC